MNVWVRKVRRKAACRYCPRTIEVGEYQVVCQYYMKVKSGKTWWMKMLFHPQCWLDRAIAEIESKVVVETRGRKRAVISDESREMRGRILRKRASVMQRINMRMSEEMVNYDKVGKLVDQLSVLSVEIEPYGGVPSSWN